MPVNANLNKTLNKTKQKLSMNGSKGHSHAVCLAVVVSADCWFIQVFVCLLLHLSVHRRYSLGV